MKKLFSTLVLAAAIAGSGQAASVVKPVPTQSKSAAQARVLPDPQIERAIRAKFAKSKINSEHFTVTVQNGVAKIEGKTNVIQHKGVATRLAKSGGAVAVKNNIQVSEEAKAKAAARLANGRGQAQLARATVQPAKPE